MYAFIIIGTALVGLVFLSFLFFPDLKKIPEYISWRPQKDYFQAQISTFLKKWRFKFNNPSLGSRTELGLEFETEPDSAYVSASASTSTPAPNLGSGSSSIPTSISGPAPNFSPLPSPSPAPLDQKPFFSINTYITSGPKKGEIIEETNSVTFKFKSKVSPEETKGSIKFETKVEGIDEDWKSTYSNQRTIKFPPGPKEYTFLVRAKINNIIDPTPARRTFKINTSPYFGKVKIYRVRASNSYRPSSLITLKSYLKKGEEINITDWRIKGQKGGFIIPQAIEKYNHLFYSQLFGSNVPLKDIFIKQSDTIYLSSALNPLGRNKNFRLNKCFGYLTNDRDFAINFYNACPRVKRDDEEILNLDAYCQRYVLRRKSCEIPKYWKDPKVAEDSECINYIINNFNYIGCYNNYLKDENFLKNEWHIYMNRNFISDGLDILYLRDQNGFLIDKYFYGSL